jgi:hypothetical protein
MVRRVVMLLLLSRVLLVTIEDARLPTGLSVIRRSSCIVLTGLRPIWFRSAGVGVSSMYSYSLGTVGGRVVVNDCPGLTSLSGSRMIK